MRSARQIEHDKMIDRLDVNGILDRYFGKADTFILVSPFDRSRYDNEPYERKYRYGKVKLQKSDADDALAESEKSTKKYLKRLYNRLSDKNKASLPPFDTIYEDIKAECSDFNEKRLRGEMRWTEELCKEYDKSLFFKGDNFWIYELYKQGKVKYNKQIRFFEECYEDIGRLFANDDNEYEITKRLMDNTCVRPLDYELRKPPFNELLPHLISVTPTFMGHCHYGLKKEFRFRFNAATKAWLAEHYKFGPCENYGFLRKSEGYRYGLENLTFYDGDKVLFYQCSHESYQFDYLERFDD